MAATSSASYADPEWEFNQSLERAKRESASGNWSPKQEQVYVTYWYNRWQTYKNSNPFSWWWKMYFPPDYNYPTLPDEYLNKLLAFVPYNPTGSGGGTVPIGMIPYDPQWNALGSLPQTLVDAHFAAVEYQVLNVSDGTWTTIGTSSDWQSGYSITYTFSEFEPIVRGILRDDTGHQIQLFDEGGNTLGEARLLAVAVPEPSRLASVSAGLLVLTLVFGLRRRRQSSAPRRLAGGASR
jgi:hypothetical protein